jgi:hypothetical protein
MIEWAGVDAGAKMLVGLENVIGLAASTNSISIASSNVALNRASELKVNSFNGV